MDEEQKRRLAKGLEAKYRTTNDPPLIPFEEFQDDTEAYLRGKIETVQIERIKEVQRELRKHIAWLNKVRDSIYERHVWKRPKWTYLESKKPRRKVSPLFWKVYGHMWENTLSRSDCMELTESKKLKKYDAGKGNLKYLVFTIVDAKDMARKFNTTFVDRIRKQIDIWCRGEWSPWFKMGMDKPKKEHGKMILAVGYWNPHGRISFFTERDCKQWLKKILFKS